jgi:hypothetical protein
MLHHAVVILLVWCPVSLAVALLVGASCKVHELQPRGFTASLQTDFQRNGRTELEEDEMPVWLPSTFHIQ